MKSTTDGSYLVSFYHSSIFLIIFGFMPNGYAKNIHDILKPTKSTLDWLDRLDTLEDTLENNTALHQFDKENVTDHNPATESINWLKQKSYNLRTYTRVNVTDHFSVKPGKIKSRPLKFSEVSDFYEFEEIGEEGQHSKSQRSYGLKFNYNFR